MTGKQFYVPSGLRRIDMSCICYRKEDFFGLLIEHGLDL